MDTFSVLLLSAIVLVIQLFLCFKIKNLIIRLLPVGLLVFLILLFLTLMVEVKGWDVLFYMVGAIISAILLIPCTMAWLIWGIVKIVEKTKNH